MGGFGEEDGWLGFFVKKMKFDRFGKDGWLGFLVDLVKKLGGSGFDLMN